MTTAIIFGFAVAPGHKPVPGTAPLPVLARQLPRSLVLALNDGGDKGVRFFPFLGRDGEQRRHLQLDDVLPLEALQQFAQSSAGQSGDVPELLVDGILSESELRLRIHRTADGRCMVEEQIPFDRTDPEPAITRALFDITGALGWGGGLPTTDPLTGPALAWFLVARDDLLSWEAGVAVEGPPAHRLRAIHEVARLAGEEPAVHSLAASLAAHAAKDPALLEDAVALLNPLVEKVQSGKEGAELVSVAALLMDKSGDRRAAASLHAEAAGLEPRKDLKADSLRQAVALWFLDGDFAAAADLLDRVLHPGTPQWDPMGADAGLLTQRLAVADRRGEKQLVQELCKALSARAQKGEKLSPQVLRMVTAQLAAAGDAEGALELAQRGLGNKPAGASAATNPGLQLEHARALLLAGRSEEGLARLDALATTKDDRVGPELRREAGRLARLAAAEGLLPGAQQVEVALHEGRADDALKTAKRLVKEHPHQGEAWFLLGVVEQRREKPKRAAKAFQRALDEDGDMPEAANRLGILLVAQGRAAEGVPYLEQAVAGLPGESAPRLHLAQACAASGDRAAGEQHLDAAESLGADPQHIASVRALFFAA